MTIPERIIVQDNSSEPRPSDGGITADGAANPPFPSATLLERLGVTPCVTNAYQPNNKARIEQVHASVWVLWGHP